MKKFFLFITPLLAAFIAFTGNFKTQERPENVKPVASKEERLREITGTVQPGETLHQIFKRYGLDIKDLFLMSEASASVHKLGDISANRPYKLLVDEKNLVQSFTYGINDNLCLNLTRKDDCFAAQTAEVEYEKRTGQIGGAISDNLVSSIGKEREGLSLALDLSDIFAWDIDFSTDLRNGDTFRVVVEELYLGGEFKRYGKIIAAEFINNGRKTQAFRFEHDGKAGYYDEDGNALKRAFLKAPLSFRRISSGFSSGRFHPVLKRYRPHHGIDYAASAGTPVSAVGDGTVAFSGYKGDYGKLVIIRHPNGYKTYYGHLSRIGKGLTPGAKVGQGDVIGFVGSTGLATGPHLHYEMRVNDSPMNPLRIKFPGGAPIQKASMAEFEKVKAGMADRLASISVPAMTARHGKEVPDES